MPSTDRKLELKAKTSVAQTASQVAVYAKGLINQECLWDVKSENYRNRNIRDKALEEMVKQLNIPDLPPFFYRLPCSLLWNRVNSIVHRLNSTALIIQSDRCKRSLRL
jgi:hypothetical protein